MAISVKVTRDDISPALSRMAREAKNPTRVLRAMGTTFKSITEGNFNSSGAEYRPTAWAPKRDGMPSILQRSTTMAKAFHLEVTSQFAKLSNPMIYAAIHQFGGVIRARAGKMLSWMGADGKRVFAKQVRIPARPFFPVDGGKLTPKAEEKIAAAAQRMMRAAAEGQ